MRQQNRSHRCHRLLSTFARLIVRQPFHPNRKVHSSCLSLALELASICPMAQWLSHTHAYGPCKCSNRARTCLSVGVCVCSKCSHKRHDTNAAWQARQSNETISDRHCCRCRLIFVYLPAGRPRAGGCTLLQCSMGSH